MKMIGLILMALSLASAELIRDGPCPIVEPVKNFDMSSYAGRWYHLKKIILAKEGDGQCPSIYYTNQGDSVKVRLTHVVDNEAIYVDGVVTMAEDAHGSGKIVYNLQIENGTRVEPITIVATDYNNYSISYSCKYFERSNKHSISMWILSRFKYFDCETKTEIDSILQRNFAHVAPKLKAIDQSGNACRFYNTRVYTAPYRSY